MSTCCNKRRFGKRCIVICKPKIRRVIKCVKVIKKKIIVREGGLCPCGNQIDNPGFEEELAPSWVVVVPPAPPPRTGERSDQGQDVHTGDFGFVMDAGVTLRQTNVPVAAGCCYELMFWAKGSSGNTSLTANVYFGVSMTPALTIPIESGSMDNNSWTSYRDFTPCVPAGVTTATVEFIAGGEGGDNIALDDIILASAGSCPTTNNT